MSKSHKPLKKAERLLVASALACYRDQLADDERETRCIPRLAKAHSDTRDRVAALIDKKFT